MIDEARILELLSKAKKIAQEYRAITGKPLGITGEVAEYEAARLLGVQLTSARNCGFDAVRPKDGKRFQIKGRCILTGNGARQRLGSIDVAKEFDAVLLVLLDSDFEAMEIFEADRAAVVAAITAPGSKARNERGALAVQHFKRIGRSVWRRERWTRSD